MKAYMCDNCKKAITENDLRITLSGYTVHENEKSASMPKGYSVGIPEEFCSFTCLANWADEQQKMLNDYKQLCKKRFDHPAEKGGEAE
jgi:hypothetical protein